MVSNQQAHTALVTEQEFIATQAVRFRRSAHDGTARSYLLTGLLRCGLCGRRMDAHWVNQRPGYRCRHGHTSSQRPGSRRRKILYLREDHIIARLATHPSIAEDARSPHALATFLRANRMGVVCDQAHCTPIKEFLQVNPLHP
ncbi:zinc ribbon domain-containing protein [Micromonospora sp. WMMD1082]|uniref:zinc ribbon domain-containing protein n=1 Tax=Micromonospora sp. WMMD1082 TaxID=3016104 RepID=UPI002417149C|nr:zinc ribbon domain-containing protein [Micromonospora sp. WMMD1082]MDG4796985.1 zinc ribbon domain-containing protein [Micromonospora sp. WMMD1082]